MSVASLRSRVNALSRQLIVPLNVVRLRPIAEQYCDEWAYAMGEGSEPPPCTQADPKPAGKTPAPLGARRRNRPRVSAVPLFRRITDAGYRLPATTELYRYTQTCRLERTCPQPNEMLRLLLPKAVVWGLLPRFPNPVDY